MATLYIRDVPDDVAAVLRERATHQGKSLSSYVAGELASLAARPTNAEVLARLRSRDRSDAPTLTDILSAQRASRR